MVESSQKIREGIAHREILPGQWRHARRYDIRQPIPYGAFRLHAGKEIVQRECEFLRIAGRLRKDPQVRCREVAFGSVETALAQCGTLYGTGGDDGGEAENMGIAIHRHPVQRKEIVAGASAAHVHRGRAVGAGGNAGQALGPAGRVALAQGRDHAPHPLNARVEPPQARLDAPGVSLHRRLQRITPYGLLSQGDIACQERQ